MGVRPLRRSRLRGFVAIVTCLVPLAQNPAPAEAAATIEIGTVSYNPPGPDAASNTSLNSEFVTLRNTGDQAVDLADWTIEDSAGNTFRFGSFSLEPARTIAVHTGSGKDTAEDLFWDRSAPVWGDGGDTATLRDANGATIQTCPFGKGGRSIACSQILDGRTVSANVFTPDGPGPFPGVVVVPGGGWKALADWNDIGAHLASEGFVAFVIRYRLAPPGGTWHFPAPGRDVSFAVAWVRAFAGRYGVEPSHVGALGGSAGGNLAMLAGVTGTVGADRPDVVVSWSGPTRLRALDLAAVSNYLGCHVKRCTIRWKRASPYSMADQTASPMYLANSEDELTPLRQATTMAAHLADLRVPYELRVLSGARHSRGYAGDVWDETVAFLHAHLS